MRSVRHPAPTPLPHKLPAHDAPRETLRVPVQRVLDLHHARWERRRELGEELVRRFV